MPPFGLWTCFPCATNVGKHRLLQRSHSNVLAFTWRTQLVFSSMSYLVFEGGQAVKHKIFWSAGFWQLSLFTEVGSTMQVCQEYFSLMVVLVYLHGKCASCMVNAFQFNQFVLYISIQLCVICVSRLICCCKPQQVVSNSVSTYPIHSPTFAMTQ